MAAVAFEEQHRVDEMLEHARPGDGAFLGHMADEDHGCPGLLRETGEAVPDLSHLGDRPGRALEPGEREGLDRVHR